MKKKLYAICTTLLLIFASPMVISNIAQPASAYACVEISDNSGESVETEESEAESLENISPLSAPGDPGHKL